MIQLLMVENGRSWEIDDIGTRITVRRSGVDVDGKPTTVLEDLNWARTEYGITQQGDARVPDAMIQIEGKDWYPNPTGSGSRQQVERCREDARQTP